MNFFEHQRLARRNSRIMVLLFAAAVLAVVVAVDIVLGALYAWSAGEAAPAAVYVAGAAATAALILCVSLFNVARLAEGGVAVARMIGARRVTPGTTDPLERRLCNVVEEMAIASGVRVPEVYVMDGERGINAFAAGWDTSSAVVAVTRGTLQTLTRDELQGVVAHEFSHILNGDMRLNVRMLGVLAGIVFIGSVGEFVMRSARGSRDSKGFILAGLALFVIGYVGLIFARLIKAAVSREREFLADASSVQFTRNPDGIAGALDQIRVSSAGTLIANRYAEEMSHMFFGAAVMVRLARLFDTHPPLDERIRRVHPQFPRSEYRAKRVAALPLEGERFAAVEQKGRRGSDFTAAWDRTPGESAALVGTLDPSKMEFAGWLLAALPQPLRESVRSVDGARAVMLALLLAEPEEAMRSQLEAIGNADIAAQGRAMAAHVRGLGLEFHLPLIDLALPAIKAAPEPAKNEHLAALEAVVNADRRVSLHEFVVLTLVRSQLAPRPRPAETKRIADLKKQAATLLALVARAGTRSDATGEREAGLQAALTTGASILGIPTELAQGAELSLNAVNEGLEALRSLAPIEKGLLVKGLFAAATVDGTIRVAEAALMRLVGAVLDCPLP
ncbi:MAG TPA: M48 family metallopeptidase, partial [Burkholderiales bacterium]|nr:M48 family metallopeptidase [Burkholderiales bacterium]